MKKTILITAILILSSAVLFAQSSINTDKSQVFLSGKTITAKSIDNTKSITLSHDGTNGVIDVSSGSVSFPDSVSVTSIASTGTVSGSTGSFSTIAVTGAASVQSITASGTVSGNSATITNGLTVSSGVTNVSSLQSNGTTDLGSINTINLTQADLTSTCSQNNMKIDTGGANKEFCFCTGANNWLCIKADSTTGPFD